jgi:hypothetical protein
VTTVIDGNRSIHSVTDGPRAGSKNGAFRSPGVGEFCCSTAAPTAVDVPAPMDLRAFAVSALAPRSTDFRSESPDPGDRGNAPDREDLRVDGDLSLVEDSPAGSECASEEVESGGAAELMAGVVVSAAPTPRATASVPILPVCLT